jgi:hypothetical protein
MGSGPDGFDTFHAFYGYSNTLQAVLAPEGKKLHSPAAELIKRQADRQDLPLSAVVEAELLVLMMAFILPDGSWYPQTLHYASRGRAFPFFLRAAQHRSFLKLATVTGIDDADELRAAVKEGHAKLQVDRWMDFWMDRSFSSSMNLDALDTLD